MKEEMICSSEHSTSGIYTLIIFLSEEVCLNIGNLGKRMFPKGYYTYTGSAMGKGASSLKYRIARHLRKKKRMFWHIDYLLANEKVSVKAVVVAETNENLECALNRYMKSVKGAKIQVKGFGATDCRKNCGSHLLSLPEITDPDLLVQRIISYLEESANILSISVVNQSIH